MFACVSGQIRCPPCRPRHPLGSPLAHQAHQAHTLFSQQALVQQLQHPPHPLPVPRPCLRAPAHRPPRHKHLQSRRCAFPTTRPRAPKPLLSQPGATVTLARRVAGRGVWRRRQGPLVQRQRGTLVRHGPSPPPLPPCALGAAPSCRLPCGWRCWRRPRVLQRPMVLQRPRALQSYPTACHPRAVAWQHVTNLGLQVVMARAMDASGKVRCMVWHPCGPLPLWALPMRAWRC